MKQVVITLDGLPLLRICRTVATHWSAVFASVSFSVAWREQTLNSQRAYTVFCLLAPLFFLICMTFSRFPFCVCLVALPSSFASLCFLVLLSYLSVLSSSSLLSFSPLLLSSRLLCSPLLVPLRSYTCTLGLSLTTPCRSFIPRHA